MTSRAQLLARYAAIGAGAEARTAAITPPAAVTAVHREVVGLLDELLGQVGSSAGAYSGLLRTFRHLEPALLRDFAKADPAQVIAFARYIGQRLLAVGGESAGSDSAQGAGQDQSQSA